MSHKFKDQEGVSEGAVVVKKLPYLGWLLLPGFLMVIAALAAITEPLLTPLATTARQPPAYLEAPRGTTKIPMDPQRWTRWVSPTGGTTYRLTCPTDCEIVGWDGAYTRLENGKQYEGQLPPAPFKLRGAGIAEVTVPADKNPAPARAGAGNFFV